MVQSVGIGGDFLAELEQALGARVITDERGYWVWVNRKAAELFRCSRQELVGRAGADLLPGWPQDGVPVNLATLCPYPDGSIKFLTVSYVPSDLAPRYRLFAVSESPPHISEIYYRTLFNLLPVGVSVIDREGNLIAANPASAEILGVSVTEHCQSRIDSPLWRVLRPDGTPMPPEEYGSTQTLHTRRPYIGQIKQVIRPDGSRRWLSVNSAPSPLENGAVMVTYTDITEQTEAQNALQKVQKQIHNIAQVSPAVIYSVIESADGPSRYEYLSPAFERIHEISVTAAYENPRLVYEQCHPQDRQGYQDAVAVALRERRPFEHTWRIITPSGKVKWLRGHACPEYLDNGDVRWSGVVLDITEQKALEQNLERKVAKGKILETVVRAIRSSLDLDEVFTIAATTISQEFQMTVAIVQFLPEKACWQYKIECSATGELNFTATEIPDLDNPFAQALKNGQVVEVNDTQTLTDPINQKIAQQFPGAWLLVPIRVHQAVWGSLSFRRSAECSPWQFDEVNLARRVSEQLGIAIEQAQVYRQLQLSKQQLRLILENTPAAIVQWRLLPNYQMKYEYISPQNERIFGYTASDLMKGSSCWENHALPEDWTNIVLPALDAIYAGTDKISIYYRSNHPKAGIIWVHEIIAVQSRTNPQAISVISVVVDVTDLKYAQTQVEELTHLNQLKDDFVSTVSHELRTPLANIQMATKMLELTLKRQGLLTDDPESQLSRYFAILKNQTQREVNLVNDLLDLARLESGGRCPTCIPMNLRALLPPLLEGFRERAAQQQQILSWQLPEHLPPVFGYVPYLERMITELLGNACKYTPAGEKIILSAESEGEQVYIRVTNTGVEIPPEEQPRIFEKFYRIRQLDRWQHGGTGLGLALVKELVERMGGRITLTSGAGQTCFSLALRRG